MPMTPKQRGNRRKEGPAQRPTTTSSQMTHAMTWRLVATSRLTKKNGTPPAAPSGVLKQAAKIEKKRTALYFCNYKENKKNNICMLDTLFIEDFIDSMEEYFHF